MNEVEFSELIDCKFPYDDIPASEALVVQAKSISESATFMVLEEICRPPRDASASKEALVGLVETWRRNVDHPLANIMASTARAVASGSSCSVPEAIALMEQIAPYRGLYSALNIASFCCDDVEGVAETQADLVRALWER
ncbi:hypothetical protein [Ruegeria lacuscaerulensis]|uniref:hypothetical protein n=1 Tax=Ruegeria lacuscaerulensis TaxID=55218 RepID=UPI00147B2B06|nr:hypothetical protein [Ruegeria lacuscaerulensis]